MGPEERQVTVHIYSHQRLAALLGTAAFNFYTGFEISKNWMHLITVKCPNFAGKVFSKSGSP